MDRQGGDTPPASLDVALLDAGAGRRLERLGAHMVDRPAPMAIDPPRLPRERWREADLRFEREAGVGRPAGWRGAAGRSVPGSWPVEVAGLRLGLRPTASGGVGLYPEQIANVPWLEGQVEGARRLGRAPAVLNLFAHTGLLTLAAARAGAAVTHVDGARGAVAWARENAAANGLADRPIRWIVDDATGFVERESRRARRFEGFIVDPPSFGRGAGSRFRLRNDLARLLDGLGTVAAPGAFFLFTAHTTGLESGELEAAIRASLGRAAKDGMQSVPLTLRAESGAELRLGWAVRIAGGGPA